MNRTGCLALTITARYNESFLVVSFCFTFFFYRLKTTPYRAISDADHPSQRSGFHERGGEVGGDGAGPGWGLGVLEAGPVALRETL